MAYPLTIANLEIELKSLVHWEIFGTHLRDITREDIEKITRDKPTTDEQKLALYCKWLNVCPNPSWRDVVEALEKAKEIALAGNVTLHVLTKNSEMQTEEIMFSAETEEDTIINTLEDLDKSFDQILIQAYEYIETMVKADKKQLQTVRFKLKIALKTVKVQKLHSCSLISEIFDILREHTHFLDGSILKNVIQTVIGRSNLLQDIDEHIKKAKQFKSSSPIKELKGKLNHLTQAKQLGAQAKKTRVIIKLNNDWGHLHLGLVEMLAKKLLGYKGETILLLVESGCIQITIAIPNDSETGIIDNCSQQLQLAQLMGVVMIQTGSHSAVVNIPENNNADYTFERAILKASRVGNIEAVELLLEMSIDADHTDEQGQTPLIIASKNGHGNIVKHLLTTNGVNVNKQDNIGRTAVMVAKTIDIYQALIQANADTSIVTHRGSTPLMVSCFHGNHEVANHLLFTLKHNITTRSDGLTLLIAASRGGNHKIVEHLLDTGHDPNVQSNIGKTAIEISCLNGHFTITETLLKHNANPNVSNYNGWTPLMSACQNGHYELVELLINITGNNLMTRNVLNGITALMLASMNGHQKTMELLLAKGHDPNVQSMDGSTAMKYACINNHYLVVECLLKNEADPMIPDYAGCTPLMYASQKGHFKIIQLLIQHGVNPNTVNYETRTPPLIYASENGHSDVVNVLLTAGANPNIQNKDGRTPLELASLYGYYTIVELLLKHNADPTITTKDGWTPLMAASQEGYNEIVELLLQKGVDPNVRNKCNGRTALIQASKNGHNETVQLLLQSEQCDSSITDYEGLTATEHAFISDHDTIVQLLQTNMAEIPPPRN